MPTIIKIGNTAYLGDLNKARTAIENAMSLAGPVTRSVCEEYLKTKNLGDLDSIQLSPVTAYLETKLNADEQATFEFVSGLFTMAKARAKAYNENNTFEALYAAKK